MRNLPLVLIVLSILIFSCEPTSKTAKMKQTKQADPKGSEEGRLIISAVIVSKSKIWKGEATGETELYIQRSIQDYYIKFCKSSVTKTQVQKEVNKQEGLIKAIKLEIEYKNGEWDNCQENEAEKVASRTGEYVIIHRIVR